MISTTLVYGAHPKNPNYLTEEADLEGHQLVMTATDDPAVNALVATQARARGTWVNSADDPENCSFILPAVTRRGPVVVAVGTDGASPALARHLRDRIAAEILTPGVEVAAGELARQRAEFHAQGISTEESVGATCSTLVSTSRSATDSPMMLPKSNSAWSCWLR